MWNSFRTDARLGITAEVITYPGGQGDEIHPCSGFGNDDTHPSPAEVDRLEIMRTHRPPFLFDLSESPTWTIAA
jgi:hypothetical protein